MDKYFETIGLKYLTSPAYEPTNKEKRIVRSYIEKEFKKIPYPVYFVDGQPYENQREMSDRLNSKHPLLVSSDFNVGDDTIFGSHHNLLFRAVHDYYHHRFSVDFSLLGEYLNAQMMMSATNNPFVKQVLFSEIIGQVGAYKVLDDFVTTQKLVLF